MLCHRIAVALLAAATAGLSMPLSEAEGGELAARGSKDIRLGDARPEEDRPATFPLGGEKMKESDDRLIEIATEHWQNANERDGWTAVAQFAPEGKPLYWATLRYKPHNDVKANALKGSEVAAALKAWKKMHAENMRTDWYVSVYRKEGGERQKKGALKYDFTLSKELQQLSNDARKGAGAKSDQERKIKEEIHQLFHSIG